MYQRTIYSVVGGYRTQACFPSPLTTINCCVFVACFDGREFRRIEVPVLALHCCIAPLVSFAGDLQRIMTSLLTVAEATAMIYNVLHLYKLQTRATTRV